jgi:Zn-dependent protease
MVSGVADNETMGRTAVAGPITNVVLAAAFTSAAFLSAAILPTYASLFVIVAWFNAWIAVFNLIPFGVFDGLKVYTWNKRAWALMFAASVILMAALAVVFFGL